MYELIFRYLGRSRGCLRCLVRIWSLCRYHHGRKIAVLGLRVGFAHHGVAALGRTKRVERAIYD